MTKRQRQDAHHQQVVRAYYQNGEEAALGPVLAELRPRLLALARGSFGVRDAERAEDLVQETLTALLQALRTHAYAGTGTLAAYAGAYLRFVYLYSRRHKPSDPNEEEDSLRVVRDTSTSGPTEEALQEAAAVLGATTQAVLALDPNARAAVVLHFYQGLPAAEAAARLGIPQSHYSERLRRGLLCLRQWASKVTHPTAEVYDALPWVNTGDLFQEPLRMAS